MKQRRPAQEEEEEVEESTRVARADNGARGKRRKGDAQLHAAVERQIRLQSLWTLACYLAILTPILVLLATALEAFEPVMQIYAILALAIGALLPLAGIHALSRGAVKALIMTTTAEIVTCYAKPTELSQIVTRYGAYNILPGFGKRTRFDFFHGLFREGPTFLYIQGNPNPIGFDEDGTPQIELDSTLTKKFLQRDIALKLQRASSRQKVRDLVQVGALVFAILAAGMGYAAWDAAKTNLAVSYETLNLTWQMSQRPGTVQVTNAFPPPQVIGGFPTPTNPP